MANYKVSSGATSDGINLTNGQLFVSSGGTANHTVVSNGGTANVLGGGVANFTVVSNGGTELVMTGGTANFTVVSAGGTEEVASGGTANGVFVATAGAEQVDFGGVFSGGVVSDGAAYVSGRSTDTVLSAGFEYVYSGGVALRNIVSGRGKVFLFAGAVASGTVLSGGDEFLFSSGVAVDTLVKSGGLIQVNSAGSGSGSVVLAGGQESVLSGGIARATVVSGGTELVFGQASATVLSGGNQNVFAGGVATGTVARGAGAIQLVMSGGRAINSVVSSGARESVQAHGVVTGTTVSSGGVMTVDAGGAASLTVIQPGGSIDLTSLIYASGGTASVDLFDTLTVTEGGSSASLQLSGLYIGGVFQLAPEAFGGTGTVITLLGAGAPTPRIMAWRGISDTNVANPANWNDLTNLLSPALTSLNATDTGTFLSGGGTITGAGNSKTLEFGGYASWQLTTGASLTAATDIVVGQGGAGTLLINGGAAINGLGQADNVSGASGQAAAVTVDGAQSAWKSAGELIIGTVGTGNFTVSNAASVSAAAGGQLPAMALGDSAGATGSLVVTGPGSTATLLGQLDVGRAGAGTLTVSNQGTVSTGRDGALDASQGLDIGQLAGGSGQATVIGAKSLLTNIGRFIVGDAGFGGLQIGAGGAVVTTPGTVAGLAGLVVANTAGAANSLVNVFGAGSRLNVTGLLDLGAIGSGILQLGGGATVTAGSLDVGRLASAVGQIGVTGAGTRLIITNGATVADDGTGVLSVLAGATFSAASLTIGSQGNSSGAVILSGAGSEIDLTGALNIGTALGTGDLTVGPGAAVHASVVNQQGQVVLEGGLLDPTVNFIGQGQTAGGFGTIAAGDIIDEGVIQAGGTKPSQRLLIVQGTVLGGGTLTIDGTSQPTNPAGVLQINPGGTLELTGPVLNAASTTFTDNLTPTGTYTVTNSVVDVTFADAAGVLLLDAIAGFAGTITTYQAGDAFVIPGGTLSSLGVSNGNTLTVSDSGVNAGAGGIDRIIFGSAVNAAGFNIVNGNEVQAVACFAAGTLIETATGAVAVEALAVGDRVVTHAGTAEPIVWLGARAVDCERHPAPETVWPVRVSAGAFGPGLPARDLYLSPDHAVLVNAVLVPVRLLVNGTSIVQVWRRSVTYHHVELPRHDVILAEGLLVESYLDLGDRANFAGEATVRRVPDFAARLAPDTAAVWEMKGAAPLVLAGDALDLARREVARRGGLSGPAARRRAEGRGEGRGECGVPRSGAPARPCEGDLVASDAAKAGWRAANDHRLPAK